MVSVNPQQWAKTITASPLCFGRLIVNADAILGMDIETGRPADSGPQFCDPYPSPEFDKLFEKVSADLRLGDEENVYYAGHGMGMLIEECLSDLDVFDCWDLSDRITTYRVR